MPTYVDGRRLMGMTRLIPLGTLAAGAGTPTVTTTEEIAIYEGNYATTAVVKASGCIFALPYDDFTVTWFNDDDNDTDTVTVKIWVTNAHNPPAMPTTISSANMKNAGFSQLGADVTVAQSTSEAVQWTGKYNWIVISAVSSGSATDQEAFLRMSNSV